MNAGNSVKAYRKWLIKSYTNEEVLDKLQDVGIYKGQLCIIPSEQAYNADSYKKFGFIKEDKYVYKMKE